MIVIDRRYFRCFDWISLTLVLCISAIGLAFVLSATYTQEQPFSNYFFKQVFGVATGVGIYLFFCTVDFRLLMRAGYFLYFAVIALLVFTIIKGHAAMGGQRWIDIRIVRFQPSELAKLLLPPFIAYYLQSEKDLGRHPLAPFIPILIVVGVSFLLVLKQPDLGTALIIGASTLITLWFAGLSKKFLAWSFLLALAVTPVLYHHLHPYQRKRIETFMGGGSATHERYHVEQSKIAIGSGGLTGKGFLQGTQNRLAFLPVRHTDFIFAVLCEEWGLLGSSLILFLYALLIARLLFVIGTIKSLFAQILCLGLLTPVALSAVINIGMVTGLMPVVGIPLPFMSYGLSHTWISFATLGWINGVVARRFSLQTVE